MKLAVVGSRDYPPYARYHIETVLQRFWDKYHPSEFISGGARGVDSLAEYFFKVKNVPCLILKPDWAKFGRRAGMVRNEEIIRAADVVIAFTSGTPGTANSIAWAKKLEKVLIVFDFDGKMIDKANLDKL